MKFILPVALALSPIVAESASIPSFDVTIIENTEVYRISDGVPTNALVFNGWTFEFLSSSTFRISSLTSTEPENLRFRHSNTYVFISDIRYPGNPTPADPETLTLIDGDASNISDINTDVATTGFGIPGMSFNISGEGSGFGTDDPDESWTFAFTSDLTPVPVPASVPLLLGGLGLLGWAARRRA